MRTILLVLAFALAGCSAADEPAPVAAVADGLEATATTGILRCVVVDNAIIPLADVLIIVDTGKTMRTGADGECAFDGLDAGPHIVSFAKQGYVSSTLTMHVEAGVEDVDIARVQLEADPLTTPRVDPYHVKGHIVCASSYTSLCGISALADHIEDTSVVVIPIDEEPLWFVAEAVWTDSQPTQDQMMFNLGPFDGATGPACCEAIGASPLAIELPQWTMRQHDLDGDLYARLYPYEIEGTNIEDNTGYCAVIFCHGPGFAVQQDFEVIAHAFYHFLPEPGYRFLDDGAPSPP